MQFLPVRDEQRPIHRSPEHQSSAAPVFHRAVVAPSNELPQGRIHLSVQIRFEATVELVPPKPGLHALPFQPPGQERAGESEWDDVN